MPFTQNPPAPALDANTLAYFWNQVNSGHIPAISPDGQLQQHPHGHPPPFPQFPLQNPFPIPPFAQQTHPPATFPPMQSYAQQNSGPQFQRIEELTRAEKEEGEVSEEGELSTPGSRGSKKSKGYNKRKGAKEKAKKATGQSLP